MARFFCPTPIDAGRATLRDHEAHHLARVLRLKPGDEVTLFDGSGAECRATVEKIGRSTVKLKILAREEIDRELDFELTLAVALPKGDRQRWLVEKAVELGVWRLVPLVTERGVAQPLEQALARLRRTVIEASKQCGRNRLMEIAAPLAWPDYVKSADPQALRLLAHPAETPAERTNPADATRGSSDGGAFLAVGPEGGFTVDELAAAQRAGWTAIDLGPRTLRVETAAALLVALVLAKEDDR